MSALLDVVAELKIVLTSQSLHIITCHRSPISNTVISPDTYNRYLPTSHGFNKILCIHPIESKHRSE